VGSHSRRDAHFAGAPGVQGCSGRVGMTVSTILPHVRLRKPCCDLTVAIMCHDAAPNLSHSSARLIRDGITCGLSSIPEDRARTPVGTRTAKYCARDTSHDRRQLEQGYFSFLNMGGFNKIPKLPTRSPGQQSCPGPSPARSIDKSDGQHTKDRRNQREMMTRAY
jgi:hypothetical protein